MAGSLAEDGARPELSLARLRPLFVGSRPVRAWTLPLSGGLFRRQPDMPEIIGSIVRLRRADKKKWPRVKGKVADVTVSDTLRGGRFAPNGSMTRRAKFVALRWSGTTRLEGG